MAISLTPLTHSRAGPSLYRYGWRMRSGDRDNPDSFKVRSGARWLYEPDAGSSLDGFRRGLRSAGKALQLLPRTRDFTAIHQLLIDRGLDDRGA